MLSQCDVFIGNEGGPRHIAHALGLPTASVFSPQARRQEWLPKAGRNHQAIEWQDVLSKDNDEQIFEIGDSAYYRLYNAIKPKHFIPIVDSVLESSVSCNAKSV